MKTCTSPSGQHTWRNGSKATFYDTTSTLVSCIEEGCDEMGYRLTENDVVAQNPGQPGEELF